MTESKNTETVGRKNGNLLSPVFHINRLFVTKNTSLGLVLAKLDHAIRCTLDVSNVLAMVPAAHQWP